MARPEENPFPASSGMQTYADIYGETKWYHDGTRLWYLKILNAEGCLRTQDAKSMDSSFK